MKILLLSYKFHPDVGGIEVNSELLAAGFVAKRHNVVLASFSRSDGGEFKTFPYEVVREPGFVQLLKLSLRADVVFENNSCLRLAWPTLILHKAHVIALRTWIRRSSGAFTLVDYAKLFWLRLCGGLIANSKSIADYHGRPAIVIGNPYRKDLFTSFENGAERDRDFVFLGRLVSDKGADLAVSALAKLGETAGRVNARLTIIGDGPERSALETLAQSLGVADRVHFAGRLQGAELAGCLRRHKFLIVPSRWPEPFGNVALEGMACGCVPIVSSGGGLPDAVGDAGVVFESGNLDALTAEMGRLLGEPALVETLQARAVLHLAKHTPEHVAGAYLQVLETVAGVGRPVV